MNQNTKALLAAVQAGDPEAEAELFQTVYDELHRLARMVRRNGAPATLNTTALLHEAYLHLSPVAQLDIENKRHFFRIAARAMRQVIARSFRHRGAQKRGGDVSTLSFSEHMAGERVPIENLITIEHALSRLEDMSDRQARIVECRFYAGFTIAETAAVLDVSTATVKRDWRTARAWLSMHLGPDD